jgi:autotransporter-associated beta strand protein
VGNAQSGTTTPATLLLASTTGLNVANSISVPAGSTGVRTIGGLNTTGINTFSGTVSLGTNLTLSVGTGGELSFTGMISGAGGITATGAGTVLLAKANTFTGPVTVSAGILQVQISGALGGGGASNQVNVLGGATLELSTPSSIAVAEAIFLAGTSGAGATWVPNGDGELDGPITLTADTAVEVDANAILAMAGIGQSGSGTNLFKNGTGLLVLTGANTFTGDLTINAGTVQIAADNRFNGLSGASVAAGATLNLNNFSDSLADLSGAGTISFGSTGGGTLTVGANNSSTTFAGVLTGTGTFVKTGTGTLTISSNSAIPSTVAVNVNGGTLALGATVQSTGPVSVVGGSITGTTGSLSSPSYTLNNGTVSAQLGGATSSLTVNGGHSYLSGTNSYGGSTQVNSGILEIQPSGRLTATSGVTVATGASLIDNGAVNSGVGVAGALSGTGSVTGTVTINSGGAISPGSDTSIGSLATGPLTLTAGGSYHLTLNSSNSTADTISATGAISLGTGVATLAVTDLFAKTLLFGTTFTILQSTTGVSGYFANLSQGALLTIGANTYQISYTANSGRSVTLSVVPEPTAPLYCICGVGLLTILRRRGRH